MKKLAVRHAPAIFGPGGRDRTVHWPAGLAELVSFRFRENLSQETKAKAKYNPKQTKMREGILRFSAMTFTYTRMYICTHMCLHANMQTYIVSNILKDRYCVTSLSPRVLWKVTLLLTQGQELYTNIENTRIGDINNEMLCSVPFAIWM